MKKQKAIVWVKLLRSGEYEQGPDYLKQILFSIDGKESVKYCCLGILCDHQSKLKTKNKLIESGERFRNFGEGIEDAGLPYEAMIYWGVKQQEGKFNKDKVVWPESMPHRLKKQKSLAGLNDKGATFPQIADFIELNYRIL